MNSLVPTSTSCCVTLNRAAVLAVAALLAAGPTAATAQDKPVTSAQAQSVPSAPTDAAARAAEVAKALAAKAGAMDGTWTLAIRRGEKPAGTLTLSVRGHAWALTAGAGPSALNFYCDGEQVYDLEKLERYDLAKAGPRLPEPALLQLLLANVRPAEFLGSLGDATATRTEGNDRVLRFRPKELPKDPKAPQVMGRPKRATDVAYDAARGTLSAVAGLSLDAGRGSQVRVEAWAATSTNEQGHARPSRLSIVNVEENKAGTLTAGDKPTLTADVAYAPVDTTLLDAGANTVAATAFFATPRDALLAADVYRDRMATSPTLSDQVALAQATLAARDLVAGLQQWDDAEAMAGEDPIQRRRLAQVLAPVAAESVWFAAKEKDKAASAVAVLAKVRAATDDAQWRFVAPQAMFAWKGLRAQPTLDASQREELDGQVLPRLCRSGNPSVLADLMRLAAKDASLKPLIDECINATASEPLPEEGYVNSPLSSLVAAAVNAGGLPRGQAWLDAVPKDQQAQTIPVATAFTLKATSETDLTKVIAAFAALLGDEYKRDASAAAARQHLLDLGVSVSGVQPTTTDLIGSTAALPQAKAYWDGVFAIALRPSSGMFASPGPAADSRPIPDERVATLARQYATAFTQPDFESRTLIQLASRMGNDPTRRAAQLATLELAMGVAPDDHARVDVVGQIVRFYLAMGEIRQARSRVEAARRTVRADEARGLDAMTNADRASGAGQRPVPATETVSARACDAKQGSWAQCSIGSTVRQAWRPICQADADGCGSSCER